MLQGKKLELFFSRNNIPNQKATSSCPVSFIWQAKPDLIKTKLGESRLKTTYYLSQDKYGQYSFRCLLYSIWTFKCSLFKHSWGVLAVSLIHIYLILLFPWKSKQFLFLFFFLSLVCLTNFAQYYSSCHSSFKSALAAAKMQSEVSTMIGKCLSTCDRLCGSSSMTFYLETQAMQAVAHCIWYTPGTAVVSVRMRK